VTVISGHNQSALSNFIFLISDSSHFLPSFRLPLSPKGDPAPVPSVLGGVREYLHIPLTAPSRGRFMKVNSVKAF
jgi:hypothetical protein